MTDLKWLIVNINFIKNILFFNIVTSLTSFIKTYHLGKGK